MTRIAQYSSVCAGSPLTVDDSEFFDLANHLIAHPNSTFCVRVSGESMRDAGIFDGDILIVDKSVDPRPSDIVVAQIGDGFTVKRYVRERGLKNAPPRKARSDV